MPTTNFLRLYSAIVPCTDIARARSWYEQNLGFKMIHSEGDTLVVFQVGDGNACLSIQLNGSKPAPGHEVAFEIRDAAALHAQLSKLGVEVSNVTKDLERYLVFAFQDSEGNELSVFQDLSGPMTTPPIS